MSFHLPVVSQDLLPSAPPAEAAPLAAGPEAPPWPHTPTVEWQVCGACNYDCSYCIQSRAHRVGFPDAAALARALAFLAGLPGVWEIKMTGGEPFVSRAFLDVIVPGLMATAHRISVLTNLSAPAASLRRFGALTRGRLAVVSASLHLEFTDVCSFLSRLEALREAAGGSADVRFVVNAVLAPAALPALAAAKERVLAAGFPFFPQLMKVKHGVHAYSARDMELVRALVGRDWETALADRSANLAPSYEGRRCWSGARYLVLTQSGEAWSCRSARRHGEGFLGDTTAGIRLRPGPVVCPYTICPCTVPANRGLVEGVSARVGVNEVAGKERGAGVVAAAALAHTPSGQDA